MPDFQVTEGQLVPEVNVLYGLTARGDFARLLRFEAAAGERGVIALAELVETALQDIDSAADDCYAGASWALAFTISPIPAYAISGFFHPVDMAPIVNVAKAGQTIPLKFRVLDENGAPYLGLVLADIAVTSYLTSVGSGVGDAIEQYTSASGLQNFGDGNYQFNWKTPKTYALQNRDVRLTVTKTGISFGTATTALFKFTK